VVSMASWKDCPPEGTVDVLRDVIHSGRVLAESVGVDAMRSTTALQSDSRARVSGEQIDARNRRLRHLVPAEELPAAGIAGKSIKPRSRSLNSNLAENSSKKPAPSAIVTNPAIHGVASEICSARRWFGKAAFIFFETFAQP